jgi:putative peptide zinc metalloprotease protein
VLVSVHWTDLSKDLLDRLLIPGNALALWLVFPLIKTVHEFGHAFAVKAFGGEVHDMGVMILVFTPIPYVDASSASAFRSKWQRIAVGGAGMAVELFVATGALVLWISAEPGLARLVAYNVIMIAGISTLLFNANPLLRYDGYYMLADLLEIPNLYTRSRAWVYYLVERHLFGRSEAEPPPSTSGERAWFVLYAVSSFLYRAFVVAAIALFVIQRVFYIGILLAGAALLAWTAVPAAKGVSYLFTSPRLRQVRARAILVTVAVVALVVGAVGLLPVPFRTRAEGVVWIPDEAFVRAETEGFVDRIAARPGARVRRGDVLVVLRDPMLIVQGRVLEARMRELQARYDSLVPTDRVKTQIVLEEMKAARQELDRVLERLRGLTVRSGADGTFVLPLAENLPGRVAKKGELLGHVVDVNTITVRTVVAQAHADLVRHRLHAIEVRLSERLAEPFPAALKREVPGGSEALPSPALGSTGGGAVAVDPRDERGTTAMQKIFQVDLELPSALKLVNVGGRVYVRFDHGREPLAVQWYRELRQLFLARFNV